MKGYIDEEGFKSLLIAVDAANFIEDQFQELPQTNEILSLAKEIRFLEERCNFDKNEELIRILFAKVKYFGQICECFADVCTKKGNMAAANIWWTFWQKSKVMADNAE